MPAQEKTLDIDGSQEEVLKILILTCAICESIPTHITFSLVQQFSTVIRNMGSSSKVESSKNTTTNNEIVELSDTSLEECPFEKTIDIDSSEEEVWIKSENIDIDIPESSEKDFIAQSTLEYIVLNSHKYPKLSKMIAKCTIKEFVDEIPQEYNGNCVYELSPNSKDVSKMIGMEQMYDGHCWVKPVQTRMKFPALIRRSKCGGHFVCKNNTCPIQAVNGRPNETAWTGKLMSAIKLTSNVNSSNGASGTLKCFHCDESPMLLGECPCIVYYILATDNGWTQLFIHQGTHNHPVARGVLRSAIQRTKELVTHVISEGHTSGPRHLQLNLAKQMVMGAVVRDNGDQLSCNELLSILHEMRPLVHTQR